tara:strand:- start:112 stop:327 length:216 start_codon:yes stop_codon:yes gene_type:complete
MGEKEIPARAVEIKFAELSSPEGRLFTVQNVRNKNQFFLSARRVRKTNVVIKIPRQRINVKFLLNQFKFGI